MFLGRPLRLSPRLDQLKNPPINPPMFVSLDALIVPNELGPGLSSQFIIQPLLAFFQFSWKKNKKKLPLIFIALIPLVIAGQPGRGCIASGPFSGI